MLLNYVFYFIVCEAFVIPASAYISSSLSDPRMMDTQVIVQNMEGLKDELKILNEDLNENNLTVLVTKILKTAKRINVILTSKLPSTPSKVSYSDQCFDPHRTPIAPVRTTRCSKEGKPGPRCSARCGVRCSKNAK